MSSPTHPALQWGPATFHQVSLENLAKAMHITNRLCCVWLDTTGREITVRRPAETTVDGWLHHGTPIEIKKGQVGGGADGVA